MTLTTCVSAIIPLTFYTSIQLLNNEKENHCDSQQIVMAAEFDRLPFESNIGITNILETKAHINILISLNYIYKVNLFKILLHLENLSVPLNGKQGKLSLFFDESTLRF